MERLTRFRAFAWPIAACTAIAAMVGYYLQETRHLGALGFFGVILGGVVVGASLGGVVLLVSEVASRGVVHALTAAGNLRPNPSFSYQESLVARGRYTEAADSFREHLTLHSEDHDARIALAGLCATHLADPRAAERIYLEVRASQPSPRQEWVVSQALIDLYRKSGDRGRHLAELARMADRYRGTNAADAAKRVLQELKRDGG